MTHKAIIHLLAMVLLIIAALMFIIDVGTEMGWAPAIRLKWSLLWILLRYAGVACGVLLALDVVF